MDPATVAALMQGGGQLLGGLTSAYGASQQLSQGEQMHRQFEAARALWKRSLQQGPTLEMQGLRSAGLHPYLRYGSPGASSTPFSALSVSPGTPVNPLASLGDAFGSIGSSAADVYSTMMDAEKTEADIERIGTDIRRLVAETQNIQANTDLTEEQRRSEVQRRRNLIADNILTLARAQYTEAETEAIAHQIDLMDADTILRLAQGRIAERGATVADIALGLLNDFARAAGLLADHAEDGGWFELPSWATSTDGGGTGW